MKAFGLSRGVWAVALLAPVSYLMALSPRSDSSDQGLKIIQTSEPQVRTTFNQILPSYGEVRIIINVDDSGKLVDWLPVRYSHPDYYNAAVDALKEWEYKPAKKNGEPIGVRQQVVFSFESRGQVVSLTTVESVNAVFGRNLDNSEVKCVYRGAELDTLPKPVKVVQPLWVPAIEQQPPGSGVMVDFYIDETGHPRMPTVSKYADPTLALSAVHALEQWQFSVPTHRGRPVVAHAMQWFAFGAGKTPTS